MSVFHLLWFLSTLTVYLGLCLLSTITTDKKKLEYAVIIMYNYIFFPVLWKMPQIRLATVTNLRVI